MPKIAYERSYDGMPGDIEYDIYEDGHRIGYVSKEKSVWGYLNPEYTIGIKLEDRFGIGCFSGHSRIRSLVKEIQTAVNEGSNDGQMQLR